MRKRTSFHELAGILLLHIYQKIREKADKVQPGQKYSKQFKFGSGHKLEATHAQELRSKQAIPIHTGKIPKLPKIYENSSEYNNWKKKADVFAAYFLTAFRPEEKKYDDYHRDNSLSYNWEAFEKWMMK